MARVYRFIKGCFAPNGEDRELERKLKNARCVHIKRFHKLPKNIDQLDDSYKVLMRELAKH